MNKNYRELWKKRSLIYNFAIMDLKIRYRNSILGFFWTILEPLLMLGVLYLVFTKIFKYQIEYYPLYILLGLIFWTTFSRSTGIGLDSLIAKSGILTQINMPREVPIISTVLTSFFMLCFELVILGIFMAAFQFVPPVTIIFLPLILILLFVLVLGITFPLSVLNVRYRDIKFVWSVVLQAGFFLTPIFYKLNVLPNTLQKILYFSPMVQIIDIAHEIVLYDKTPTIEAIATAIITTMSTFVIGYTIFRRLQSRMMEEL
ncbi:MAG: ABC transporter permease [Nitrosotalea sp.]